MPDVFDLAPKIELHLHLEGAIPKPALWKLIERYGDSRVHRPDDLETLFEYRDFAHFIDTWQWMLPLIRTADDFTMIAEAVANSLADQHIVYAEAQTRPVGGGHRYGCAPRSRPGRRHASGTPGGPRARHRPQTLPADA